MKIKAQIVIESTIRHLKDASQNAHAMFVICEYSIIQNLFAHEK